MFIKINELYNFFVKSGFQLYASILEKIALEESDFKEKYPNVYSVWDSKKDKPLSAYIAQISRAEEKGIDLSNKEISSFQDIVNILRAEKQDSKSSKVEEVLNTLKENGLNKITEEDIKLAFGSGLNQEEIIYLAKDKCNHTWEEKLHYANRFKAERLALFDESTKLTDFKDIDEVRDEYFSRKNAAPLDLQKFYEGIRDQALKSSEIVYNSKNFIVVHSKSEKAAQYWEQSCVTVDDKGKVNSGLCSAHPYESMFDAYDEVIYSFQIITKEYETLNQTPRTSFMSKNKGYNLISFSIYKQHGIIAWGGQDTVNRFNEPVNKGELFVVLGEEYDKIKNAIKNYCRNKLSISAEGFLDKKEDIFISPKEIEALEVKDPEIIENSFKNCPVDEFFGSEWINLNEDLYNKYFDQKIEEVDPFEFFDNPLIYIPEDARKKASFEKLKSFKDIDFFKIRKKEFIGWSQEEMGSRLDSKEVNDYIPREDILREAFDRAGKLKPEDFFTLYAYFPKENKLKILEEFGIEKASDLNGNLFLSYAMPFLKDFVYNEKYNLKNIEKFKDIFSEKVKESDSNVFFEKWKLIPADIYKENFEDKINGISPRDFFNNINSYPKEVVDMKIEEMSAFIDPIDIFYFSEKIPKEYLKLIINEKLSDEKINKHRALKNFIYIYGKFSDIISDSVRDEYLKEIRFHEVLRGDFSKDNSKSKGYKSFDHSNFKNLFGSEDNFKKYMLKELSKEGIHWLTSEIYEESINTFGEEIRDLYMDAVTESLKGLSPKEFFKVIDLYGKGSVLRKVSFRDPDMFNGMMISKAKKLSPDEFFELKDKIPKEIFEKLERKMGLQILKRYSSKRAGGL